MGKLPRHVRSISPFHPYSHGDNKLFEMLVVYLEQKTQIKVTIEEFLENLKQLLFRDIADP